MTDIDALEALAKGAMRCYWGDSAEWENVCGDRGEGEYIAACNPERMLALIAEMRALREALSTPIAMGIKWSPISSDMLSGFSQEVGESALKRDFAKAKNVTVYYGEKRVFTSMAEFCAAHPRGKA